MTLEKLFDMHHKVKLKLDAICQEAGDMNTEEFMKVYESLKPKDAEIDKVIIKKEYSDYYNAYEDMDRQGVEHLGWLNAGVKVPDGYTFESVYSNWSGTQCLYCDTIHRVSYSVDMGD